MSNGIKPSGARIARTGGDELPASITFLASLPPIQSAISLSGDGNGARVKIDIPETDAFAALWLQLKGSGKLLKITIEIAEKWE
jgi:hypothetical protein